MGITSVKITNAGCPASCAYCYEKLLRDQGFEKGFNLDKVIKQMEDEYKDGGCGGVPYLHGGEALMAGHDTVRKLLRKSWELSGSSSIQTYGTLIDDEYVKLFKKYKTHVGSSVDGPWPLNKLRAIKGQKGEEVTEKLMQIIVRLRNEGISTSVICVLHRANALPEHLPKLKEWLLWLKSIGISGGRLNLMNSDHNGKEWELSEEEAEFAWRELFRFTMLEQDGLSWQPFHDAVSSVLGLEQGTCVFADCEYYRAKDEPVVFSDGSTGNCLKTAKDGKVYPRLEQDYRPNVPGFGLVRYQVLPLIDQEAGGCKGCEYWMNCRGGCPAEGYEGDWRNKSRFCKALYGLFQEADQIVRRLMPNVVTTSSHVASFPNGNTVIGMLPTAFARMDRNQVDRPSTWRGNKFVKPMGQAPVRKEAAATSEDGWISEIEHIDGELRHLDSDNGRPQQQETKKTGDGWVSDIEHIDGDLRHLDSDKPKGAK